MENIDTNDVGEYIKRARSLRGLSQEGLGELADVNATTVWSLETGRHAPRPVTLRRLAKGLGIEVSDIMTGNLDALTGGQGKSSSPGDSLAEESGLAGRFRDYEQRARKVAAGLAVPRTAPSLALALEEEIRWLDQQEGSLPESVIEDYLVRALQLAGDVERALGARERDLVREIAAIREAQERLSEIARDEGRARSAS